MTTEALAKQDVCVTLPEIPGTSGRKEARTMGAREGRARTMGAREGGAEVK